MTTTPVSQPKEWECVCGHHYRRHTRAQLGNCSADGCRCRGYEDGPAAAELKRTTEAWATAADDRDAFSGRLVRLVSEGQRLADKWESEAVNYEARKDCDYTVEALMLRYCKAQLESLLLLGKPSDDDYREAQDNTPSKGPHAS